MTNNKYGILGVTGFLGSHIYDYLLSQGYTVVGGSRRTGVDATSIKSLSTWLHNYNITHVINAAAYVGGIGLNSKQPADLWLSSMQISANVLDACYKCDVQKTVMLGTVCSYAQFCPTPFKEEYLMHYGTPEVTNSAYAVAKLAGLFGCQAYRSQYGLNSIYLIPVNLYGSRDNFDDNSSHVIPALIKKVVTATRLSLPSIEVWGTGIATREFLYVEDCARAIVLAIQHYNSPDPINIGSGQEISIKNLVELICSLVGYTGQIKWNTTKPDGQPRRLLDTSKAKELFGFEANIALEEGLKRTIEYYKVGN